MASNAIGVWQTRNLRVDVGYAEKLPDSISILSDKLISGFAVSRIKLPLVSHISTIPRAIVNLQNEQIFVSRHARLFA